MIFFPPAMFSHSDADRRRHLYGWVPSGLDYGLISMARVEICKGVKVVSKRLVLMVDHGV